MNIQKLSLLIAAILLIISAGLISQSKINLLNANNNNSSESIPIADNNSVSASLIDIDKRLLNANREFAFKLFSQTLQEDKNSNVFISPTSVAIALSLLYNGADGETQQQMARVLELQDLKLEEVNDSYQKLHQILENKPEIKLSIANSLWLRKEFPIEENFLENNQKYYQAEVTKLDFNDPKSLNIINSWVSEKTNQKIENIVDEISPDNVLFLINAIYFKGSWMAEFDPKLTQKQPFFLESGDKITHELMSQKGEKMYFENEDFQAVQLPYGKGESQNLNMYIFLPKEGKSINSFINNLTAENWQQWQQNFSQQEGFISLPKFKLEYEISLNKTLQTMGMTDIFTREANFKNITSESVAVDEVKHKTFIEVNEEGTEAAAATSIGVRITSLPVNQPFKMIVNRPFFYAIGDNQTDTILFMGKMLNPNK